MSSGRKKKALKKPQRKEPTKMERSIAGVVEEASGSVKTLPVEQVSLESKIQSLQKELDQYQQYVQEVSSEKEKLKGDSGKLISELKSLRKEKKQWTVERHNLEVRLTEALKQDPEPQMTAAAEPEVSVTGLKDMPEPGQQQIKKELDRIRLKEKEIENRYELLKRDSKVLLDNKDKQILELQKERDRLEIELENLDDRLQQKQRLLDNVESKKNRLIETLNLSLHLLSQINRFDGEVPKEKTENSALPPSAEEPEAAVNEPKPKATEGADEVVQEASEALDQLQSRLEDFNEVKELSATEDHLSDDLDSDFEGNGLSSDLVDDSEN